MELQTRGKDTVVWVVNYDAITEVFCTGGNARRRYYELLNYDRQSGAAITEVESFGDNTFSCIVKVKDRRSFVASCSCLPIR